MESHLKYMERVRKEINREFNVSLALEILCLNIAIIGIIVLLGSCTSGRLALDGETFEADIKQIPIRGGVEVCTHKSVSVLVRGYEFVVKGIDLEINLRQMRILNTDPDLYLGVSKSDMHYTVYYYAYRSRFYIQITPIPKGFTSDILENETAYVITTDKICNSSP